MGKIIPGKQVIEAEADKEGAACGKDPDLNRDAV